MDPWINLVDQLIQWNQFLSRVKRVDNRLNDDLFKQKTNEVHAYLARWVYGSGIPFNAINNDGFQRFCEAVGQFGPGYVPTS